MYLFTNLHNAISSLNMYNLNEPYIHEYIIMYEFDSLNSQA